MENCLIFGGAGFLGYHLCKTFYEKNYSVYIYNRRSDRLRYLQEKYPNIKVIEGDFSVEENYLKMVEKMDVVFHLISTTNPSNSDVFYDLQSNVLPLIKLVDACAKASVKKFIYFSSGGTVYGIPQYIPIDEKHQTNPISSYGIHKLTAEKCIEYYGRNYGLDYNILRISNPYGEEQNPYSNQGVLAVFLAKAICGEMIQIWGNGSVIRDYVDVHDVMTACYKIAEYKGVEKVFNIGSGVGLSLKDIVNKIEKQMREKLTVQYLPARIQDVAVNVLNIGLIKQEINWQPQITIDDGILNMINSWDEKKRKFKLV